MGELAALWPHRTGGTPSYAYEAFRPLGESTARHIGGVAGWSYWLGWFPVAPINMILAASYIAALFHVPLGRLVDPLGGLGTPEGIGVLIITMVGLVVLFIPCYLGVRLGTGFATLLGIVSMVPITLLVILPVFKPSTFHWSNVSGFHFADPKTAGFAFVMSWLFVMSWNGIGVEGAACYVAECRNPQSRRQDRHDRRRPLRPVHLRRDRHRVRGRARGIAQVLRPVDRVHQLRRSHLRLRRLGQVPDRHPAHRRPACCRC